ncbi:MAG TPA: hypothetical protein VGD87_02230, partial [Archangium sp.]
MSNSHPLESLVGPLRFACAKDFANLGSVKGLRTTLSAALERGRTSLAPGKVQALEAELSAIDSADVSARKASIARVVAVMRGEGIKIDAPSVPVEKASSGLSEPVLSGVEGPVEDRPTETKKKRLPLTPTLSPAGGEGAPRTKKSKKKTAEPEETTKLLSIAPASGPLATPLKNVG